MLRVIKVADDLGEVEPVDVALVSVRPNQGSNLVAVTQQSPCQVRADEARRARDKCEHRSMDPEREVMRPC